ncbi:CoA transferase [Microbacterium sp. zg-YB36]|uniref:CaiB/BaiF CoA transferase family protein n=1 Tax=Microbacterium sp. zg-YB36 TaxID=2969407 RepID=UPI00214B5BD4|nr:CoA transferase [Microbacterium sp. zg-YB36]MDL5353136.1 CoA transferase [Microbacterium sp. zg-YB36]
MTASFSEGSFLTGIRVLELADEVGEYCGKVLAGLGADVIKVEPPGGERTRNYGPFYEDVVDPERSLYFWHYNFGKRSVVIDLDSEEGRRSYERLARSSDVIIDTRARGDMDARGLGFDQLRVANPELVYARVSPFGDDGPWSDFKGSDIVHLALGGVMMNCGYDPLPDGTYDTAPIAPQMWQAYHVTGENAAIGIVAALYYRLHSSRGQLLSTAVHEAVSKNTEMDVPNWIYRRASHNRLTCRHSFPTAAGAAGARLPATPRLAQTKDDRWILPYSTYLPGSTSPVIGLRNLFASRGIDTELNSTDFDDPAYIRQAEGARRADKAIAELVGSLDFDEDLWLDAQRSGLTWAPIRRPEENVGDPHWAQRDTFFEVEHPEFDATFTEIGAKWRAPGLPWRTGPRAPRLGEHTEEILTNPEARRPRPTWVGAPPRAIEGTERSPMGTPWALGGVRVLDLGWLLASAGAGRFLSALGAEVVKVEHSSKIDMMRPAGALAPLGLRAERDAATRPIEPIPTESLNRGGAFMENNTGKRAISLNLKTAEGIAILKQLVADSDVLIEGYSPGTLERMGLGYDVLKELNPALVYVQQSGMGEGTYGRVRSFGPTAQALSGISDMSGLPDPQPPAGIGYSYLDWFGAYQAALAMVAGLFRQRATGEGCWIESSQVESGIYATGTAVLDYSANGRSWQRIGNRSPFKLAAPHGAYRVAGADRWIALSAFTEAEWHALTEVLERPLWRKDARFATLAKRAEHQDELDALVAESTAPWDGVELMQALQAAAVPAGICQTAQDRCEWDPQLAHLGWLAEFNQSEIGRWPAKTPPTKFSETPGYQGGIVDRHGPNYGEDNDYVYRDLLSMTAEQIEELTARGVF